MKTITELQNNWGLLKPGQLFQSGGKVGKVVKVYGAYAAIEWESFWQRLWRKFLDMLATH